jgi:MFS family permease
MTLMGVINSYEGLLVTRFFLGVAESGFFPAATYLLTIWLVSRPLSCLRILARGLADLLRYLRYEVQRRMAVFYAAASLSGAFSGLLAYGIQHVSYYCLQNLHRLSQSARDFVPPITFSDANKGADGRRSRPSRLEMDLHP